MVSIFSVVRIALRSFLGVYCLVDLCVLLFVLWPIRCELTSEAWVLGRMGEAQRDWELDAHSLPTKLFTLVCPWRLWILFGVVFVDNIEVLKGPSSSCICVT